MCNRSTYSESVTPKICIVGAGFGGLTVGIQLKRKLGLESFTIFEKNPDLGGAWLVNRYPGAACDLPSNVYSWSFETNPEWSHHFAKQPEILAYMEKTARKHDLYSHLVVNTSVRSALWEEERQKWKVNTLNVKTGASEVLYFDVVVISVGHLWNPEVPKVFDEFPGLKMHTAQWDNSVDFKGKSVAVVGSGLSAIQVIPSIIQDVSELHYIQRTPIWVGPKPTDVKYNRCARALFRTFPFLCTVERKCLLFGLDAGFTIGLANNRSLPHKTAQSVLSSWSKIVTRRHKAVSKLTRPSRENLLFCRNFATSNTYYKALCSDKTKIYQDHVTRVAGNSIVLDDGREIEVDVLILATGFKTQEYFGPITVIGEGGENVGQSWVHDRPKNYYGACTSSGKNLFFTLAPQSIFLHSSALTAIEFQTNFIIKTLQYMMSMGLKECHLKPEVEARFTAKRDRELRKSVWGSDTCQKTYVDRKGYNTFIFHGRAYDLWKGLKKVDNTIFNFK